MLKNPLVRSSCFWSHRETGCCCGCLRLEPPALTLSVYVDVQFAQTGQNSAIKQSKWVQLTCDNKEGKQITLVAMFACLYRNVKAGIPRSHLGSHRLAHWRRSASQTAEH